jgi:hypothetical protein
MSHEPCIPSRVRSGTTTIVPNTSAHPVPGVTLWAETTLVPWQVCLPAFLISIEMSLQTIRSQED